MSAGLKKSMNCNFFFKTPKIDGRRIRKTNNKKTVALRLSDFVTCRKRYYNQSRGGSISQLWNTVGR